MPSDDCPSIEPSVDAVELRYAGKPGAWSVKPVGDVYRAEDIETLRSKARGIAEAAKAYDAEHDPSIPTRVNNARYYDAAHLLSLGAETVELTTYGTVVNGRYVLATHKARWRQVGRSNWYWHKGLDHFYETYVARDQRRSLPSDERPQASSAITLSIPASPDLHARLTDAAAAHHRTVEAHVLALIEEHCR